MFPMQGCPFEQVISEYPRNYARMIQDLEKEFGLAALPSVVGEMGVDGERARGRTLGLRKAQAAIADQPELKGKVRFVRTAQYWDPKLDELEAKRGAIEREQRKQLKEKVAADVKDKLEGKDPRKQREILDNALGQAVRNTAEYKAWQADWDKIASHWECHYFGSGRAYCLIGYGLGEAMRELLKQGK